MAKHKPNPFDQTGNVDTSMAGRVDVESIRVLSESEPAPTQLVPETHLAAPEGSPEAAEGKGTLTAEKEELSEPQAEEEDQTEGIEEESDSTPETAEALDFDVSTKSVVEVTAYIAQHPELKDSIIAAEASRQKPRKGILNLAESE